MKNSIKYILFIALSVAFWACENEDIVVRYPTSTPKFDTAMVKETQITYGDSIHVKVVISDKVAPLSTLVLRVVCNNEIVNSETIRTKGNNNVVNRTIAVPFVPNRPEGAAVKVYLTETNVSNIKKDTIISTTIAKRPVITELWFCADAKKGIKMSVLDVNMLTYQIKGLIYGTTVKFRIATKVAGGFNLPDYTGYVWGKKLDGSIGLIDKTGESISITDESLTGISEVTFDALKFQAKVGGKLQEPVKTLDIMTDLVDKPTSLKTNVDFRGASVYFGKDVEITITGMTVSINNISPDYFQVTGTNTAKFLGETGLYKAYYYKPTGYLYLEPLSTAIYPEAIWVCGTGYGRPQSPYVTTASWNWNSPLDYYPTRKLGSGIYQVTMYCKNSPNTDLTNPYGLCDFKFFHRNTDWWDGHELWVDTYTLTPPFLGPTGVKGNVKLANDAVVDGVYRFTVNENTKTFTAEKLN